MPVSVSLHTACQLFPELPWAQVPAACGHLEAPQSTVCRVCGEAVACWRVTLTPVCRIENLFINRFMHMFQSSWNDFADFEKIFVKISNTISGECAWGLSRCGR